MKVITCHSNPDFDGFASCVGLKKIYPEHKIVLAGNPVQNLKEFLRFYEDYFPFITESELKKINEDIEEIIIVDTPGLDRVGDEIKNKLSTDVKITVIDHHPDIRNANDTDEKRTKKILKLTGAATTIVVNMLKDKGMKLSKEEATLFGIAIYEDTGSFLYSSTTLEDLDAIMYLFNNGLQLNIVSEYIRFDLTIDQKIILNNLLQNAKSYNIENYQITISIDETEKFVGGLSVIVSKFWYAQNVETFIAIVRMGKKVFVVGRTKSPDIDLAGLMGEFGGGGHHQAASATINIASVEEVEHKILQLLPKYISSGLKAKDIMSSPVRTALSTETIEEVNRVMEITGHSGMPVVEGNKIVGIVTKKSVDKALNHGLGKRPIKSIMTSKLTTAKLDTPVNQLRKLMVENDIGRIPILDENNILVGIVTRSDIIRTQNVSQSNFIREFYTIPSFKNLGSLMTERLPKRVVNLLRLIGFYGNETNSPVYVVGGFVRDLLLNIENYDIDIVVEGNGIDFAKYVASQLNAVVVPYEKFFTATVVFKDGFKIDVATARTEYYESPGELPQVDISTIRKDLYRRDFTINAMAIKLNPQEFGTLYDFFNCQKDLEEGIIRVLHNLSFIEDPTRMIRGIRFEQRYDFRMEEHTLSLLEKNLKENYLERVSGSRIRQEIEKILEEKLPLRAIKRMAELGMIKHIFPKTYYTTVMEEKLERLFAFIPSLKKRFENFNDFYALSTVLLEYYDKASLEEMRVRYGYPKKFVENLKYTENMILPIKSMIESNYPFSDIYKVLGKANAYVYAHLSAYLNPEGQEYLLKYIDTVQSTRLESVTGKKIIEKYQLKSGPILNTILEEIFCRKLDDKNLNEEKLLEQLIKDYLTENIN